MKGVKAKWKAQLLKKPSYKKKQFARVKGAIVPREEFKFVDLASAVYAPVVAGGTITLLNGIAQGDDYTNRDGRQATMKSVHVRGEVHCAAVSVSYALARLLLIWDNAPNGAAPTIANIMAADSSVAMPLIDNANRFTVLRDQQWPIGGAATTVSVNGQFVIDIYVKLDELTQYSGTGATVASIQNGAIWMVLLNQTATATSASFTLTSRVRFTDD